MERSYFIPEVPSTNALLWEMLRKERLPECFVVQTDFQTAGKGQAGNSWESERGENLLFSIVLYPSKIALDQLFFISQLVSLGIKKALDEITDGISIKWPNDIYWNDKKLAGILIENSLQANKVRTVVGVGLNVNQLQFVSDAPNPVSLRQLTGKPLEREILLKKIVDNIVELYTNSDLEFVRSAYADSLYRKSGFHAYSADGVDFRASIVAVQPDGQLELETESGERKGFYFKEVVFK